MTKQELEQVIITTFGSKVLPGGFNAETVANFYWRSMQEKNDPGTSQPSAESIRALLDKCQGW